MRTRSVNGFVLILVIFIMLVFGILGWTLAVMQAGNLGSAARNLQDKQALYLAESGAHWGLYNRINTGVTISSDNDCLDANDWVTHSLPPGQYKVCTRGPQASESVDVVVESIGYVPSATNYTASRQIKILANLGSFDKAVVAAGPQGLFNWTGANKASSYVAGDMVCMYYEANGNNVYNETGIDYANGRDCLPATNRQNRGARRDIGMGELPEIKMTAYELDANATILAPGNTVATSNTTVISAITPSGGNTQVTVSTPNFFGANSADRGKIVNQVLRDISLGTWKAGTWANILDVPGGNSALLSGIVNWTADDRVTIERRANAVSYSSATRRYTVTVNGTVSWPVDQAVRNFSRGTWGYTDWGVVTSVAAAPNNNMNVTVQMDSSLPNPPGISAIWNAGDVIGMVRRFTYADCDEGDLLDNKKKRGPKVLYIESDALFDVRDLRHQHDAIDVTNVGVVVEGDSVIRGTEDIYFSKWPVIYPNLATKNGNVYSPDPPDNGLSGRNFDDIIFSQHGDIEFNYLDVKAVYANTITLRGTFVIKYDSDLEKLGGYAFGTSGIQWKEQ